MYIYTYFYIFIHPYVPIRKHIILRSYDNYMSNFMPDVNPDYYQYYETHLIAKEEPKINVLLFYLFVYCFVTFLLGNATLAIF